MELLGTLKPTSFKWMEMVNHPFLFIWLWFGSWSVGDSQPGISWSHPTKTWFQAQSRQRFHHFWKINLKRSAFFWHPIFHFLGLTELAKIHETLPKWPDIPSVFEGVWKPSFSDSWKGEILGIYLPTGWQLPAGPSEQWRTSWWVSLGDQSRKPSYIGGL